MKELLVIARALVSTESAGAVLATLTTTEGSSYRRPGARLLLLPDGQRLGSISGGCLEEDVIARANRVRQTGVAEAVVYDTTSENDLVWGVGLGCHGVVTVLLERLPARPAWAVTVIDNAAARRPTRLAVTHRAAHPGSLGTAIAGAELADSPDIFVQDMPPPIRLCLFGAGDDAQPLARLGAELGWAVTVADPRPAYATLSRFPKAEATFTGSAEDLVRRVAPDAHSVAVVMTHHYVHDVPILRHLLPGPVPYVGLLGPKQRAERIVADLIAGGLRVTDADRARLHAPVGLDLGAEGPEQVALSIAAEIQATLAQRNGAPLRLRRAPIHAAASEVKRALVTS